MHRLVLLLACTLAVQLAPRLEGSVSYSNLTHKKDAAAFYASGGSSHRNKRVHLHVPAAVLLGKPSKVIRRKQGGRLYLFEHKSVPLLVSPRNVYYRKIRQRAKRGGQVCVKGTVKTRPLAGPGRYAIYVNTLKTAP